jgi:antitoxin FitA
MSYRDSIDIIKHPQGECSMANFIIRGLDERVAQALSERAVRHGRSTEAELRPLLEETLFCKKRSFADFLSTFPNVGEDEDFVRDQGFGCSPSMGKIVRHFSSPFNRQAACCNRIDL